MQKNARWIISPLTGYFGGKGEVRLTVWCGSCIFTADAANRVVYYLRPSLRIFSRKKCSIREGTCFLLGAGVGRGFRGKGH